MTQEKVTAAELSRFEPLNTLSTARLEELAALVEVARVPAGEDPFAGRTPGSETTYLLQGELLLTLPNGGTQAIVGGTPQARSPVSDISFLGATVRRDVVLIHIDNGLLTTIVSWDQVAAGQAQEAPAATLANWAIVTGTFSIANLQQGVFRQLRTEDVQELLQRFVRLPVKRGDVVIREGDPGNAYYVVETGKCRVERTVGGVTVQLGQLKAGDAFGEEALVSGNRRNATVTMLTDGALLRLEKADFERFLKKPLLHELTYAEACQKVEAGARWLDVRYPSEFIRNKLPGAINIPASEIRDAAAILDRGREYVVYCDTGRRSAAAAFILAQRGYSAYWLAGGLSVGVAPPGKAPD